MQTQNTKTVIDFTGQNIYVGIDTHYKTWMVSIYSDEFELKKVITKSFDFTFISSIFNSRL